MIESEKTLRILSIYEALDGEANAFHQGSWTVFVRTAGCSVGCRWCDTMYSWSFKRGRDYTITELIGAVASIGKARKITLTGGEPLEQPTDALMFFIQEMLYRKYQITIETAGTEPVGWLKNISDNVGLIIDYKLPSSHTLKALIPENFRGLAERHVVKFVVQDETDYQEMIKVAKVLRTVSGGCHARLVMSPLMPVGKHNSVCTLEEWVEKMKRDNLSALGIGLNLQLHKLIYPSDSRDEERGGVDYTSVHK